MSRGTDGHVSGKPWVIATHLFGNGRRLLSSSGHGVHENAGHGFVGELLRGLVSNGMVSVEMLSLLVRLCVQSLCDDREEECFSLQEWIVRLM